MNGLRVDPKPDCGKAQGSDVREQSAIFASSLALANARWVALSSSLNPASSADLPFPWSLGRRPPVMRPELLRLLDGPQSIPGGKASSAKCLTITRQNSQNPGQSGWPCCCCDAPALTTTLTQNLPFSVLESLDRLVAGLYSAVFLDG